MAYNLTRSVQKYFVVDTLRRSEVASTEIGAYMTPPQGMTSYLQGYYSVLKWWYRYVPGKQPYPSQTDLEKFFGDYVALYHQEEPSPPGRPILTHVIPFYIYDNTPTKG